MLTIVVLEGLFKGRVQSVLIKCFLLNPEKIGADPSYRFREKLTSPNQMLELQYWNRQTESLETTEHRRRLLYRTK